MPKKSDDALSKHTMLLYEGDFARLQELYPDIGGAVVVRKLVRKHLAEVDPKADTTKFKVNL